MNKEVFIDIKKQTGAKNGSPIRNQCLCYHVYHVGHRTPLYQRRNQASIEYAMNYHSKKRASFDAFFFDDQR